MATSTTSLASSLQPYGVVTLDGQQYVERFQLFVADVTVSQPKQVFTNQRLTLPGIANFLLKGLCRDITQPGLPDSQDEAFRFRLYNSEGTTWYFAGGLGVFDDRVFDNLCFGSGQFPYMLVPPVPVHASGSLIYELEDMGFRSIGDYPYIVHLGFVGAYLIPFGG